MRSVSYDEVSPTAQPWHNSNIPVLAEGLEVSIKPVGTCRASAGEPRWS